MGEFKHHHIMNIQMKMTTLRKIPAFFFFKTHIFFQDFLAFSSSSFGLNPVCRVFIFPWEELPYCKWSHNLLLGQVSYF